MEKNPIPSILTLSDVLGSNGYFLVISNFGSLSKIEIKNERSIYQNISNEVPFLTASLSSRSYKWPESPSCSDIPSEPIGSLDIIKIP